MKKLISTNPAKNYEVIGSVDISSSQEIKEKVSLANKAKNYWKDLGLIKRLALLKNLYLKFKKQTEQIAQNITQEMGMPITQSRLLDVGDGLRYFKWYLENAEKYLQPEITFQKNSINHSVYYEPIGSVAVIAVDEKHR